MIQVKTFLTRLHRHPHRLFSSQLAQKDLQQKMRDFSHSPPASVSERLASLAEHLLVQVDHQEEQIRAK